MKKGPKDTKAKLIGKQTKEFVSSSYPHLRDFIPINTPSQSDREYKPDNPPRILPKEFNPTSVTELLGETESKPNHYTDPEANQIYLPDSLYIEYLNKEVKWSRPEEYIKENILDKEIIMRFPNRNKFKYKAKIKEMFAEEKQERESGEQHTKDIDPNDDIFGEQKRDKYSIYRDFFTIINSNPVIRVVSYYTREETNEECEQRMRNEEEEAIAKAKKDPKMKNVPIKKKNDQPIEKKVIKCLSPSNISMKDGYPTYCRWLASIFQVIKDRNIVDVYTNETIWQKIYPQEDGVPIYNPKGLYIVKLYHMGKLRQIEIDDTMPCSRYDEFYLPKCDYLNEIWPSLLTKAIIKLFSYKIVSSSFQELGDYEAFYALTGLMPRMLDVFLRDRMTNDQLNVVKEVLTDEHYLNKDCYLLCYRKEKETKRKDSKEDLIGQQSNQIKAAMMSGTKLAPIRAYKRFGTIVRSSQTLIELNQLKLINKLPSQLSHFVDDVENNAPYKRNLMRKRSSKPAQMPLLAKVMKPDEKDKEKEKQKEEEEVAKITRQSNRIDTITIYQSSLKEGMKKYENKIFIGLLYDVIEFFDNREFNMNRLKPIDFSDLKDMIKQLNTTYIFKQLSREEKKNYLENIKEIKLKQKTEKTKRIEALKLKGFSFNGIKIRNFSVEEPKFYIPYTDEEIEMTKRCLLNNWAFPPIEFLDQIYEDKMQFDPKDKSPSSPKKHHLPRKSVTYKSPVKGSPRKDGQRSNIATFTQIQMQSQVQAHGQGQNDKETAEQLSLRRDTWSKDIYMQLINNNLTQFQKPNEPVIRPKGTWVSPEEFFNCFNSFLVLGNPRILKNCLDWDNNWYNTNDDLVIEESKQIIHLTANEDTSIQMQPYVIIMFSSNSDKSNKFKEIPYQITFTLIQTDKGQYEHIEDNDKVYSKFSLKSFYETKHFKLDTTKEYFLKCEGGIYPNGFFLQIISDFKMEGMSITNYLTQYLHYQRSSYKIEHSIIERNQPHLLFRLLIQLAKPMKLMMVSNQKDNSALNYTESLLINTKTNGKRRLDMNHLITVDTDQQGNRDEYLITMIITPPHNLQEESYDLDVLSYCDDQTSTNTLIQIDYITPYDVFDYYIPNKHYVLFHEYVFAGDKIYSMLNIKIIRIIKDESDNANDKALSNKGNKDKAVNNSQQIKQKPIEDSIRMKLVVFSKENEVLHSFDFFNEITIPNMIFEGNVLVENKKDKSANVKGANKEDNSLPGNAPYLLKCYIDKSELPKQYQSVDNINGIGWSIRVYASDTIAFCKNTTQEDKERAMIAAWETAQPGRSERAQESRRRYQLQNQKQNGVDIGIDNEAFLALGRERKSQPHTLPNQQLESPSRNKIRRGTLSKGKQLMKTEAELTQVKNEELDLNKKLPDINSHASLFVKNYLFYSYNERLIQYDHNYPQEEKVLNDDRLTQEKAENIVSIYENSLKKKTIPANDTFFKTQLVDRNKEFYQKVLSNRLEEIKSLNVIMKKREAIMVTLAAKREAEKKLQEIIEATQEIIDEKDSKNKFDISTYVQTYLEVIAFGFKLDLIDKAHEAISKKKEEIILSQLKKIVSGKEKEFKQSANKHLEDIQQCKWSISDNTINRLEQLSK